MSGDQSRLYELIWKRTVASQMRDAEGETVTVRIGATLPERVQMVDAKKVVSVFHSREKQAA